jgi:hypothetical protein
MASIPGGWLSFVAVICNLFLCESALKFKVQLRSFSANPGLSLDYVSQFHLLSNTSKDAMVRHFVSDVPGSTFHLQ